ncbi:MAG: hypothetical protein ACXW3D_10930 [Caulobacteraceae bacterium]
MTDASAPAKTKKSGQADDGLRKMSEWSPSADGSTVSRTMIKTTPEELLKDAKRAIGLGARTGKRFEVMVDGLRLTVRFEAKGGKVDQTVRKAAKRLTPATEAEKAARTERKAARTGGEGSGAKKAK